ncbi:MAG TPA: formyltransferase family protein, partial [Thermoanaerobaculia bacterium]|nr:formyltransferase family protein [Thermoanaerobaculia bacterium]
LSDFLRVGVLCSKRAPGLDGLLHHPFRRSSYEIDCVISSETSFPDSGVPVITHPIRSFYDHHRAPLRDLGTRELYDRFTVEMLRCFGVDVIVLLGYLYVVTDPLLKAFPGRVINVHDGLGTYPGLHATRDAIMAGENATWSIVHQVTAQLDAGPMIAKSDPFPVAPFATEASATGEHDVVRAYAYAHREWMMRSCWGNLVVRALEQVAALEVA